MVSIIAGYKGPILDLTSNFLRGGWPDLETVLKLTAHFTKYLIDNYLILCIQSSTQPHYL